MRSLSSLVLCVAAFSLASACAPGAATSDSGLTSMTGVITSVTPGGMVVSKSVNSSDCADREIFGIDSATLVLSGGRAIGAAALQPGARVSVHVTGITRTSCPAQATASVVILN